MFYCLLSDNLMTQHIDIVQAEMPLVLCSAGKLVTDMCLESEKMQHLKTLQDNDQTHKCRKISQLMFVLPSNGKKKFP